MIPLVSASSRQPEKRVRDGVIGLLVALIDGTAGGGWFGVGIAERRAAKRILRARAARVSVQICRAACCALSPITRISAALHHGEPAALSKVFAKRRGWGGVTLAP